MHLHTAGRRWWVGGCPVDARVVLVTVCHTAYLLLQKVANPLRNATSASGQDFCLSEQRPDKGFAVHVLPTNIMVHAKVPIA